MPGGGGGGGGGGFPRAVKCEYTLLGQPPLGPPLFFVFMFSTPPATSDPRVPALNERSKTLRLAPRVAITGPMRVAQGSGVAASLRGISLPFPSHSPWAGSP
eukprot:925018-Prymnesium_polylepis.1